MSGQKEKKGEVGTSTSNSSQQLGQPTHIPNVHQILEENKILRAEYKKMHSLYLQNIDLDTNGLRMLKSIIKHYENCKAAFDKISSLLEYMNAGRGKSIKFSGNNKLQGEDIADVVRSVVEFVEEHKLHDRELKRYNFIKTLIRGIDSDKFGNTEEGNIAQMLQSSWNNGRAISLPNNNNNDKKNEGGITKKGENQKITKKVSFGDENKIFGEDNNNSNSAYNNRSGNRSISLAASFSVGVIDKSGVEGTLYFKYFLSVVLWVLTIIALLDILMRGRSPFIEMSVYPS